jgi:TonB family protein
VRPTLVFAAAAACAGAAIAVTVYYGRPLIGLLAFMLGAACALLVGAGLRPRAGRPASAVRIVEPPRLLEGAVLPEDWPAGPWFDRRDGKVTLGFTVDRQGMPRDVRVARSSGVADLDARSREIIETRFRFVPARGANGDRVEAPFEHVISWSLASLDGPDAEPTLYASPVLPRAG